MCHANFSENTVFISFDFTVHDRDSVQLQIPVSKCHPSRTTGILHIICVLHEELCSPPDPPKREKSLAPESQCCHQAPCTAFQPSSPLPSSLQIFLSLGRASKFTWRWWSLNTPWSRSALCLGSLRLLLAQPGCCGCPDAHQPHGNNPCIDGAEGSAAAPSTHLLCAGLGVQLWDGVILPSAICPHRSQPLLTQLSHTSGPSFPSPLPALPFSFHLIRYVEPVAMRGA